MSDEQFAEHAAHDMIAMNGFSQKRGEVAVLLCLPCTAWIRELPVCGKPTKMGRPCRAPIRIDLGHETCRVHGR